LKQKISTIRLIAFSIFAILLVASFLIPLFGGPGTTDDPIISRSYMEIATRYGDVPLKKGEELPIPSGGSFILFDGSVELSGVGDYFVIDLTAGKKFQRGKDITESHLYVVTGGNDLKIVAKNDAHVLVKGGDTAQLRRAMN